MPRCGVQREGWRKANHSCGAERVDASASKAGRRPRTPAWQDGQGRAVFYGHPPSWAPPLKAGAYYGSTCSRRWEEGCWLRLPVLQVGVAGPYGSIEPGYTG